MNTLFSGAKRWSIAATFAALILLAGCTRYIQSSYLNGYDKDIRKASAAIEAAKSDAERAVAYADRGYAYGDKARYSRAMNLIGNDEYERLFGLAMKDYEQALALDPGNADVYYRRGYVYYGRAGLDMRYDTKATAYLKPARADFSQAVARNPKNAQTLDMLGLTDASLGDWTQAISDFAREMELDPKARYRVADAYCNRGMVYSSEKKFALAEADLNRAIEIGTHSDPCECDPYNSLLTIYVANTHETEKARAVVAKAQASKKWISPEYLEQLKTSSGNR